MSEKKSNEEKLFEGIYLTVKYSTYIYLFWYSYDTINEHNRMKLELVPGVVDSVSELLAFKSEVEGIEFSLNINDNNKSL